MYKYKYINMNVSYQKAIENLYFFELDGYVGTD